MMSKKLIIVAAMLYTLLLCAESLNAQSLDDSVIYKIKEGDTFTKLSKQYLIQPVDIVSFQKDNQLQDINRLTSGAELRFKRSWLKHLPSKATIMDSTCSNTVKLNDKLIVVGDHFNEGATLDVPPECTVSLLLEDGSVVRLPSGTTVSFTILRKNLIESTPEVRLNLTRGRIELDVNKLKRSPNTPFEIQTPISVTGVRGTEFRVGYSPEENSGQVEVLRGIVDAKGKADSQSLSVSKGFGVPINGDGHALKIEALLPAPTFLNSKVTSGTTPSYVVQLNPVPEAQYYLANITTTANLSAAQVSETLLSTEIFIPKLTKQAVFYQISSVSTSGLIGPEQRYGFCAKSTEVDDSPVHCAATFDVPLANSSPMVFSLSKLTESGPQTVAQNNSLQAKNGRFAVYGLTPGQYTWAISYTPPKSQDAKTNNADVNLSGSFDLIALPNQQP